MAKRLMAEAPEGGETFAFANPNYSGGAVTELPVVEDTTARLRRLRLAGEEPMARSFIARPDGGYDIEEVL